MGFLDDAKNKLDEVAKDHPDHVESVSDQAIERGGDSVDRATGRKYAEHVDTAQTRADDGIGER
jgi:hypothetical protein